jgi:transcriptional regulator with XRE-family HTH domain
MKVQVDGKAIKELRVKHSYTQERLAEIVGANLRTIQRIETNGVASLSTRGALAKALGVKPEELDAPATPLAAASREPAGLWPRWLRLLLAILVVVVGAAVLAISMIGDTKIGSLSALGIGGMLMSLIGLLLLVALTPHSRWRIYVVLPIIGVSFLAFPPAWTVRALVAISLWTAFELVNFNLARKQRLRELQF